MAVLNGFEELKAASPSTDLPFLDPSTATAIALPVDCHGSALSHCHPFGLVSPVVNACERREPVLPPLPHPTPCTGGRNTFTTFTTFTSGPLTDRHLATSAG